MLKWDSIWDKHLSTNQQTYVILTAALLSFLLDVIFEDGNILMALIE